jgi:GT2 family glycosyltransferase
MRDKKLADIVIVNWNSGKQLENCLNSIKNYKDDNVGDIVIVDNGSIDSSLDIVLDDIDIFIKHMAKNFGFAYACNVGSVASQATYLLFLNPDAELLGGGLKKAIDFMQSPEAVNIGICGVRLIDENGHTQRHCAHFPTWRTYLGQVMGLQHFLPRQFPPHFMIEFDHLSSREVDQVIGAFFLVRREVFEKLGGFDERFFVYFEELDFSLRARQAGWRTWYLAEAVAFHKGGGTSEQVKAHRLFYSLRSRMLYAFKHFSPPAAWAVVAITMCIEPLSRLARALLRRSTQEIGDTWRGYTMLWRDMPNILKVAKTSR